MPCGSSLPPAAAASRRSSGVALRRRAATGAVIAALRPVSAVLAREVSSPATAALSAEPVAPFSMAIAMRSSTVSVCPPAAAMPPARPVASTITGSLVMSASIT